MDRNTKKNLLITQHPVGTRIMVVSLANEEPNLKEGSTGTVVGHDDWPGLLMKWDNGSSLSVFPFDGDKITKI